MNNTLVWDKDESHHQASLTESDDYEEIEPETDLKKCTSMICVGNHVLPCLNRCGEVVKATKLEDHLTKDCPLTEIDCEFKHVGCGVRLVRRDMPLHLGQAVIYHLSKQTAVYEERLKMLEVDNERLTEKSYRLESKLRDLEQKLSGLMFKDTKEFPSDLGLSRTKVTLTDKDSKVESRSQYPVDSSYVYAVKPQQHSVTCKTSTVKDSTMITTKLIMTNFEQHQLNNDHWVSQPFFTHSQGYMMCLRVTANGQGSGKGTHITVGVYLMKGEFDDQLEWPFRGDITIQLLNQEGTGGHFTRTIYEAKTSRDESFAGQEMIIKTWGVSRFKSHSELYSKYLKNDNLMFRIFTVVKHRGVSTSQELATDV